MSEPSAYQHFYVDRAVVSISAAGIRFHRPWLKGLFIPWQEVHGVGHLVVPGFSGVPYVSSYAAAVTVGRDFYEQHIASKRSFFAPPGAEAMFRPKGEMMRVVLNSADLAVKAEDFLGPAEARWKAFRNGAGSPSQPRPHHRLWTLVDRRLLVAGRPISCAPSSVRPRSFCSGDGNQRRCQRPSCFGS